MAVTKEYFIKDKLTELLALMLFNDKQEYGCSWEQVSEGTRDRYRDMALGKKPSYYRRTADDYMDPTEKKRLVQKSEDDNEDH